MGSKEQEKKRTIVKNYNVFRLIPEHMTAAPNDDITFCMRERLQGYRRNMFIDFFWLVCSILNESEIAIKIGFEQKSNKCLYPLPLSTNLNIWTATTNCNPQNQRSQTNVALYRDTSKQFSTILNDSRACAIYVFNWWFDDALVVCVHLMTQFDRICVFCCMFVVISFSISHTMFQFLLNFF